MSVCVCLSVCVSVYVCVCVCVCVCVRVCLYVCSTHVYVHVCVHMCMYCYFVLSILSWCLFVHVSTEEAPILFPPTYRFKKGERTMRSYVYIKKKRSGDRINEPSFCDRVLWKSYPGTRINNTSYGMSI